MHDSGSTLLPDWGNTPPRRLRTPLVRGVSQLARGVLWGATMLARHRRFAFLAVLHGCARAHSPSESDVASAEPQAVAESESYVASAAAAVPPTAPSRPVGSDTPRATAPVATAASEAEAAPAKGQVVRFVELAEVHMSPSLDAPLLGVIGYGERVRVLGQVAGEGCDRKWAKVEPAGFVCAKHEAAKGAPSQVVLPRLREGGLVPGVYGKLRQGQATVFPTLDAAALGVGGTTPEAALTVRRLDVARAGGRSFWRTRHGYVAATDLRPLKGSRFRGIAIGEDGLAQPIAWARFRGNDGAIAVRSAPSPRAKVVSRMRARDHARVEQTSADGKFVQLAGLGWAARDEVRIAAVTEPPAGLLTDDERWIDIDIDEQVLVAYQGSRPVYATLISTGKRTHDTPIGTFRIERKVAERTMSSKPGDDEPYSVDRVPWTAYFTGSFALHAAYWHGSFGERKSHGCVNLAPADARVLYRFTTPAVVPAWSEVHGHVDQPGSIVRVRDDRHPTPPLYGYALELAKGLPTEPSGPSELAQAEHVLIANAG
jgi:lipoprotein-anchoring transpeptidase ErfK/SrfK